MGEFIGIPEIWVDACWDFIFQGYCDFIFDNGEDYRAKSIDDFVYAWEH